MSRLVMKMSMLKSREIAALPECSAQIEASLLQTTI